MELMLLFDLASFPSVQKSVNNFSNVSCWFSPSRCKDSTNESKDGDKLRINKATISSSSTGFLIEKNWSLRSFKCNKYLETDPPSCNFVENLKQKIFKIQWSPNFWCLILILEICPQYRCYNGISYYWN